MAKYRNKLDSQLSILKALADENRVRALCSLQSGELCVCQIIELLDLAPSTVSKHMSILKQAGLVQSRKEGRWIHHRLPDETAPVEIQRAVQWVFDSLTNDLKIHEDRKSLNKIIKTGPQELSKKQCKK